jgi:hypothetical protein
MDQHHNLPEQPQMILLHTHETLVVLEGNFSCTLLIPAEGRVFSGEYRRPLQHHFAVTVMAIPLRQSDVRSLRSLILPSRPQRESDIG